LYDEGGRGLWLVESLSRDWGVRWPATGGKIVWARLPCPAPAPAARSEEHTSELQSRENLVCRLLPEKKNPVRPSRRKTCASRRGARRPISMAASTSSSLMPRRPSPPTLLPYTTLFRSTSTTRAAAVSGSSSPSAAIGASAGPRPAARSSGPVSPAPPPRRPRDRKSTRLNSSHVKISYAVFCLKKKIRCGPADVRRAPAGAGRAGPFRWLPVLHHP